MRLVDLNPQWVGHSGEDVAGWAIQFDCPCQRGGCPPNSVMFDNPIAGEPLGQGHKWHRVGEDFEILTLPRRSFVANKIVRRVRHQRRNHHGMTSLWVPGFDIAKYQGEMTCAKAKRLKSGYMRARKG